MLRNKDKDEKPGQENTSASFGDAIVPLQLGHHVICFS